jgi:hypothetical protein
MAQEVRGDKKPANLPGTYVHPETGAELTANSIPVADGIVRAGFKPKKVKK